MNKICEVLKYIVFSLFSVLNGILCSSIVVEVTVSNSIHWENIPRTISFKLLLAVMALMVIAFVFDYRAKDSLYSKMNNALSEALIAAGVYDALASETKKAIEANDRGKIFTLDLFKRKIQGWTK